MGCTMPFGLKPPHISGLVGGQQPGGHFINARLPRHGVGGALVVAGQHNHPHAQRAQPGDHRGRFRPQGVRQGQHASNNGPPGAGNG